MTPPSAVRPPKAASFLRPPSWGLVASLGNPWTHEANNPGPLTPGARFASSLAAWRGAEDRRVAPARARHGPDVR